MGTVRKHGPHAWARATSFAMLTLILPLVLAACGSSSATNTPAAATSGAATTTGAATTAPAAATAATGSAAASATKPAASTTASGTTAASSTTAGTASGTTTASTGADPRGAAPTKRGGGGTIHLLWWQAPTILNAHTSQGTKDYDAARIIEEPLATTSINGLTPDVPVLAKEIPSTANGELSADGMSVTWKLKDGVKWSDGTPFSSADVKATFDYIVNPQSATSTLPSYTNVASR